jgi:transglutaminase-like putative cysteine protease
MPIQYDITHTTVYSYRQPVTFGEHRVMFRPRDSHDLRVLATGPRRVAGLRRADDPGSALELGRTGQPLDAAANCGSSAASRSSMPIPTTSSCRWRRAPSSFPFAYSVDERFDLEHYLRPAHDDPGGELTAWARQFIRTDGPTGTRDLLIAMNQHIREQFRYAARDEEGTQEPSLTLELGSGSCRDFALLMMEAGRRLGIATRFVSGYLYDPGARRRSGWRHAWAPATPTRGCRRICRAPAGCRSTRPTTCSAAAS